MHMHMQGASCEAMLRRLAGGKTTVLRSGPKLLYALYLVTSDTTTIVHLFFFVSAVLACTSSYPFACLNVFALVEQVPTMMYVLQVVRQNGRQMLVTILFAFMVVYVFAVWAFSVSYFRNQYAIIDQKATIGQGEDGHPHLGPEQGYEANLALFTLFHWDYGFREGPVWDFAFAQDANNTEVDYGQVLHGFVFNILHYVVVLLVFTAIVSGIIIDSFAELRAAREATRLDILHVCFVCDIDREDFETLGLDFKDHVVGQHNMWDYLFFRLYLEAKDPADFTGLETYCWEQQQKQDIHWFPIKKAVIIEGRNKEKKDITGLYRRLDGMEARADEQMRTVRKMRQDGDEQGSALKELREDVNHVRVATDEIREMLKRLAAPAGASSRLEAV